MAEQIAVVGRTPHDHRVIIYEPTTNLFLVNDGRVRTVERTDAVLNLIDRGRLVRASAEEAAPVEPAGNEGGDAGEQTPTDEALLRLRREDLDAYAAGRGVTDAASLGTKQDVVDAIRALNE